MLGDVPRHPPRAGAAEAPHPPRRIGGEADARLLAIVADVDAGLELAGDHVAHGRLRLARERRRVDRLPAVQAHQQIAQRGRTRQAAGVGGQDPGLASLHRGLWRKRGLGYTMRGVAARVHLWGGLVTGPLLLVLGLSGSALVFGPELEQALDGPPVIATTATSAPSLDAVVAAAVVGQPGAEPRALRLPARPDQPYRVETHGRRAAPRRRGGPVHAARRRYPRPRALAPRGRPLAPRRVPRGPRGRAAGRAARCVARRRGRDGPLALRALVRPTGHPTRSRPEPRAPSDRRRRLARRRRGRRAHGDHARARGGVSARLTLARPGRSDAARLPRPTCPGAWAHHRARGGAWASRSRRRTQAGRRRRLGRRRRRQRSDRRYGGRVDARRVGRRATAARRRLRRLGLAAGLRRP